MICLYAEILLKKGKKIVFTSLKRIGRCNTKIPTKYEQFCFVFLDGNLGSTDDGQILE
jgi:hypothetical protein